jgi:hypothetical protein
MVPVDPLFCSPRAIGPAIAAGDRKSWIANSSGAAHKGQKITRTPPASLGSVPSVIGQAWKAVAGEHAREMLYGLRPARAGARGRAIRDSILRRRGRSLIAAWPSRPECCPPGSRFSPRSAGAAATSGPVRKRGHCKVHNGLTRDRVPTAPTAQLPAPSPGGDTLVLNARDAISAHYAGIGCEGQRNGCPDRQTLCRRTANLRAKATRALPGPERCSMASAQVFRCSGRFTR